MDAVLSNVAFNFNFNPYNKRLVLAAEETWRHYEESLPEFEEALRMVARCRSIR
jgi:hypothetical protein